MKTTIINNKNNLTDIFCLVLLAAFPLSFILGNLIINVSFLLFSICFFINIKENKKKFKNKILYLLLFFFISLLINLIFSTNFQSSFPRIIKILFVIFFVLEIQRLIQNYSLSYMKYVYTSWFIIFLVLSLDVIFEIILGYNTIGNKSYMPGRIASFFGDELVVGAFYYSFVLFFLSYLTVNKISIYNLIIVISSVLVISFLIGERSNFIRLFISIIIFTSFAIKANYKIKILSLIMVILALVTIITTNIEYKVRYFDQIKSLFSTNGYSNYIKQSHYGAHQDAAIKIFKNNLLFGVGVKNFRNESGKQEYENKDFIQTNRRHSTHPHQIHYEFLSETGIFGYISFLIFIISSLYLGFNSYLKTKNFYQLSSIIFVLTSVLPILPTGSFLSTYFGGFFWLHFAIMSGFINKN